MSISVTKAGPYFTSGEIKWSQLRSNFKETSSGSISASELFRNSRKEERNPVVPDSTENTSIPEDTYANGTFDGVGTDWKASLMRNSIKRYTANQSGNDKFLDMGLKSGSDGIDWDGNNNLDASGATTGNYQRNVQKIINITGQAYSDDTGTNGLTGDGGVGSGKKPGAKLVLPSPLKALNTRIHVSGGIYGSAGRAGFFNFNTQADKTLSDPGKDAGAALTIRHEGSESRTTIHIEGSGKIYGGGGGGEQGQMGALPVQAGLCDRGYSTSCSTSLSMGGYTDGCSGGGNPCPGGSVYATLFIATLPCSPGTWANPTNGFGTIYGHMCQYTSCSTVYLGSYTSTTPEQGRGGAGGEGAGWGFRNFVGGGPQERQSGSAGIPNVPAKCSGGENPDGAANSTPGGAGGDGGDYGQPGGSTLGKSPLATGLDQGEGGGKGGAAICGKFFDPSIQGSQGAASVKGSVGLECDGSAGTPVPPGQVPVVSVEHTQHIRFNFPENDATGKQTLNVTSASDGTQVQCKFYQTQDDYSDVGGVAFDKIEIKNSSGTVVYSYTRSVNRINTYLSPILTLPEGLYDVEFTNLSQAGNRPANGGNYLRNERIKEYGQKLVFHDDGNNPNKRNGDLTIVPANWSPATTTTWVNSYDSALHSGKDSNGDWEYIAMKQYWSQFMRDYAAWENSTDPKTQSGDVSFTNTWVWKITDTAKVGQYTFEIQSDNRCEWNIDAIPKGATTDYDSHYPANSNTSQMGKWETTGTSGGTSYTDGTPYTQGFGLGDHTITIKCFNRKFVSGNDPEDWQHNPAGVAFTLKDPQGNIVLRSSDLDQTEGTTFGRGTISWSATNVDPAGNATDSVYAVMNPFDGNFIITPNVTSGQSTFAPTYGQQRYEIYASNTNGTSTPAVVTIK